MTASTRLWVLACTLLLAAGATHAGKGSAPALVPLFAATPDDQASGAGERSPASADARADDGRRRRARVDGERLADERLLINLFADLSFEARRERTERHLDGTLVWSGRIEGDPLSTVTFVRAGNLVQGAIRTGDGAFSIEPVGEGPDHVLRQIDTRRIPRELTPLVPPRGAADMAPFAPLALDGDATLDVLVVYTAAARAQAGGSEAAIAARIALGVAETNTAYANSGVTQRLRLVGTELVGYRESGDLADDLLHLTADGDAVMDLVHARRNAVGADLVSLIVSTSVGGACGVAWVMQSVSVGFAPYAFSVTAYPCISPNYTFGHELAHNMGAAHAPEDPNAPPAFPYAFGYKDPGQRFRTVMAYDCPAGCPRVLYFSSASVEYEGKPTGKAAEQDNALALNQAASAVAAFRPAQPLESLVSAPRMLALDAAGTSVTVSWDPPEAGTATSYAIEVGSSEGSTDLGSFIVAGAITRLAFPDVPPGTYFVRLRAFDSYGPGPPSASERLVMTNTGRCLDPVGAPVLDAAAVAGNIVTLKWSPTGGAATRFLVGAGIRPLTTDALLIDTSSASTTFTTEAAAGVYFVRVAGLNACGPGAPSNEVGLVVGSPIPGPPVAVAAAVSGDRTVTLTWQLPSAGGQPDGFVVEAGSRPGAADIAVLPSPGPGRSFTVMAPPRRYHVRIRGVNVHGTGVASHDVIVDVP